MAQVIHAPNHSATGQPIPEEVFERHNRSLEIIRLVLVELDEIIADGDEVSSAEWAGWAPFWDQQMFRLEKLVTARDAGELTLYQEVLLGDILTLLERERPRAMEHQLYYPVLPERATDAAAPQSASPTSLIGNDKEGR
jgi:hypothetical protein